MSTIQPIKAEVFSNLPWLIHGFSTRVGGVSTVYRAQGDLNLGFTAQDDRAAVQANRRRFLAHLTGATHDSAYTLMTLRQTHSDTVHGIDQPDMPALEGDGMMTSLPGVLLGILTADCVPVLVVDPDRRAVAAFHAGWRGTVQQIVEKGIAQMGATFGSPPEDLLAAIGPAIGACCYTVGDDVRQQFEARFDYGIELFAVAGTARSGLRLDLAEANRRQLLSAGVRASAVTLIAACTRCQNDRLFSHRAEQGNTGRMMSVIGVRCR